MKVAIGYYIHIYIYTLRKSGIPDISFMMLQGFGLRSGEQDVRLWGINETPGLASKGSHVPHERKPQVTLGGFPKIRVPYFWVLKIRILLFGVLYWDPLFRKLPIGESSEVQGLALRLLGFGSGVAQARRLIRNSIVNRKAAELKR